MPTRTKLLPLAPLLTLALAFAPAVSAQDTAPPEMSAEQKAMMDAWQKASTPGAQHTQLAEHFSGSWTTKMTAWMDPSAPPTVEMGKTVNTPVLGARQVRMDYNSTFMGQAFEGIGYSGYDNVKGKYISSWTDNMSTGMAMLEGDYDAASKTYTYRGEMADAMKPGTMTPIREVVRVVDKDHHVMEFYETRDGKERKTMQIEFNRAQ